MHFGQGLLLCVPAGAARVRWQGLAGAVCPWSSGPLAQTGDERTSWHSLFLYRQEVGVVAKQMSFMCIVVSFSKPARCQGNKKQTNNQSKSNMNRK